MDSVKNVFDTVMHDHPVDTALIKRIADYERAFVNKNPDHIAFFGGHLMGVHPMRFLPSDRDAWFDVVLQADELELEDGIHALKTIDTSWKRASDVMNLSCIWLAHRILKSAELSPSVKHEAAVNVMLILQYKFLGSLMAHFYPYPADQEVMLAMYASLSRKYALKVAGSWGTLLQERAKGIVSPSSIYHRTLDRMEPDKLVIDMISDVQGRLREIVKSMTAVFYQVKEEGSRIRTVASVRESIDGETVLKDKTKKYASLIRYATEIMDDRGTFVKDELIEVVADAMHTMPPPLLREALEWMSLNHRTKGHDYIQHLATETLLHAFDQYQQLRNHSGHKVSLTELIVRLRSLYMASRMSDPVLLQNKELAERIVSHSVKSKNPSVIASIRTGIQIYLVLRVMAKDYYSR